MLNMIGALAIFILTPVVVVLTVDFSKPIAPVRFVLTCVGIFLVVYFAIAIPVHLLTKKLD